MGIDPGSIATGYGVLESAGGEVRVVDYGVIRTTPGAALPVRLRHLHDRLRELLERHEPDEVVIEAVFAAGNLRSALVLGQVRGAAMVAAGDGRDIFQYSAREVKKAVAGYGQAAKAQVARMVATLLGLRRRPPQDAADALALALCHLHRRPLQRRLGGIPR